MSRKKKIKSKTKRVSFKLRSSAKKKQRTYRPSVTGALKIFGIICVLAAAGVSLYFAQKYIKTARPAGIGPLELVDVPEWASSELKARIRMAAGGKNFKLDENIAQTVAENLASVAWLDDVKVQTTHERLLIEAKWRKPVAMVKSGSRSFYVDSEMVVLDFVPLYNLPIVKIEGLSSARTPPPGEAWQSDDLAAAVTILTKLDQMDKSVTPDKPLLYEIDRIDVSNFAGRKNRQLPHIILYSKDGTEIIWGAEFGTWQRYLEAMDEEKLAKLYAYYKEYGSLSGGVKFINLSNQQDNISQPIDKY
ncbi:MAG: hypothetical protein PHY02_11105 [Phycisphaerae bacterium]|nr:hypothetical protein [Phycisphaerae bacterium]